MNWVVLVTVSRTVRNKEDDGKDLAAPAWSHKNTFIVSEQDRRIRFLDVHDCAEFGYAFKIFGIKLEQQ